MPHSVNSFDVFDTLIARRGVNPQCVLRKLETCAGMPGLAAIRQTADQQLGAEGRPYEFHDIWQEVGRVLALDSATIERLSNLEIELEHAEVIPIVENMSQVRDGDLLISDTYLPANVVASLVRSAGLDRNVGLVVSNDGKFRGWIWPELLKSIALREHFGDNVHSDGETPTAAGLKAVIYTGSHRSQIEQLLVDNGWEPLANLIREVRLLNSEARPQERHLWNLACELNFPLLLFASLWLEEYVNETVVQELFFVSRDCSLWHQLYHRLFPHRRATYFYTSRKCLLNPSQSYIEYFRSTWHEEGLLVDLSSTGASWVEFFSRINRKGRCFAIGYIDNYEYLKTTLRQTDWLEIGHVFRCSELGTALNKGVEMLNYAPHPVVEDVRLLLGEAPLPLLAETLEYNQALPNAARRSFRACIERMGRYPNLLQGQSGSLRNLIRDFYLFICADRYLPSIYSGHFAADLAYLDSICVNKSDG